jgi:hypothetical protein
LPPDDPVRRLMSAQLVEVAADGTLTVCPAAAAALQAVRGPIAVVAAAGPQRTGKSFLLSQLVDSYGGEPSGSFEVGSTVQACTHGIWCHIGREPAPGLPHVLWVDSEGLGGIRSSQQHDLRLFSLTVLLSSTLIFNSQGAIDEAALRKLAFVSQLTQKIKVRSTAARELGQPDSPDDFASCFPSLLWVVRDFALQLVDKQGRSITEREWLEASLQREIGLSDAVAARNRIRLLLTTCFQKRDCIGLPRPVTDEHDLSRLGQDLAASDQPTPALRSAWTAKLAALRSTFLDGLQPKTMNGVTLTGPDLLALLEAYVTSINATGVAAVDDAWRSVVALQMQRAVSASLDAFRRALGTASTMQLKERYKLAKADAYAVLSSEILSTHSADLATSKAEVKALIRHEFAAYLSEIAKDEEAALQKLWAPVHHRAQEGTLDFDGVLSAFDTLRKGPPGGGSIATERLDRFFCDVVRASASAAVRFSVLKQQGELTEALLVQRDEVGRARRCEAEARRAQDASAETMRQIELAAAAEREQHREALATIELAAHKEALTAQLRPLQVVAAHAEESQAADCDRRCIGLDLDDFQRHRLLLLFMRADTFKRGVVPIQEMIECSQLVCRCSGRLSVKQLACVDQIHFHFEWTGFGCTDDAAVSIGDWVAWWAKFFGHVAAMDDRRNDTLSEWLDIAEGCRLAFPDLQHGLCTQSMLEKTILDVPGPCFLHTLLAAAIEANVPMMQHLLVQYRPPVNHSLRVGRGTASLLDVVALVTSEAADGHAGQEDVVASLQRQTALALLIDAGAK